MSGSPTYFAPNSPTSVAIPFTPPSPYMSPPRLNYQPNSYPLEDDDDSYDPSGLHLLDTPPSSPPSPTRQRGGKKSKSKKMKKSKKSNKTKKTKKSKSKRSKKMRRM